MTFFLRKVGFGKCFGASRSDHWADLRQLCKIHFLSHVTNQSRNDSLLSHRIRKDDTSKRQFFGFAVSSWGIHLSSFFTFSICFKCWMTVEWSMLISSAASRVVVRGSASMIALSWLLSTSDVILTIRSSSSRLLSSLPDFLNDHCTVHF